MQRYEAKPEYKDSRSTKPAYSDEQLVLEALDDSHPAFGQLVKQYQYRVLRTIASIISDEYAAQDVAQETFLLAWSNLAKLKDRHKFGRWLNQIAINSSKLWLKDQKKYNGNTVLIEENAAVLTQEPRYQSEKLRQEVWEAVDELAEDHREAVTLYYISGYSYKEISEMLSVPVSTVQGRLQQARNQLRKEFLDMVTQLQLEIDSTVHKFLEEHAKQDGVSVEGLIIRLIERYKRDIDSPEIAVRKVPMTDAWGAPSPDGRYLSFTDWDSGNLAVRDLTTGEYRNLTSEGTRVGSHHQWAESSIWSPDSKQVAYTWYHKDRFQLRIVGLDGSEPRVLYRNENRELGWIWPHTWSRDGKSILAMFGKKTDPNEWLNKIVLVSVADGSVRALKSVRFWAKMSLSPDGRWVVYVNKEKRGEPRDIFLLATDGSGEIPLVEHPADDYGPVWSPDGKAIVFVSDRSGTLDVWLMHMTDGKPVGEPTLVKRNIGWIQPMGFTRSGSLYYSIDAGGQDVYVATLDPATGELLSPPTKAIQRSEGSNRLPAWSPDGKYLAYVSKRPRAVPGRGIKDWWALVIRSMESGEERELHAEVWKAWYLHWSPDGRSILIGQRRIGLDLIDVQTGDETPITRGLVAKSAWSPDGKTIFYIGRPVEIERGVWSHSIVAHDLETGREQELRRDMGGGLGFAISPGGRLAFFYIRRRVESGGWSYSIVAHDLGTGREQELRGDICDPREPGVIGIGPDLRISPDGRQLTLSPGDFNTGERLLKVMPTAGGEPRELLRLKDPERFCGSRWTPDGRYILFGTRKRSPAFPNHPDEPVELWRVPAEGGEPQKLLAMDGLLVIDRLLNLSIHPDGQRIVFTGGKKESEVWAIENFLPGFTATR